MVIVVGPQRLTASSFYMYGFHREESALHCYGVYCLRGGRGANLCGQRSTMYTVFGMRPSCPMEDGLYGANTDQSSPSGESTYTPLPLPHL